jgi:hypothetical protein
MYPFGVTQKNSPEPLGPSMHRWNAKTGALETWLLDNGTDLRDWAKGGPDWWYVSVGWHLVDGVPMPTSFEVRASRDKARDRLKPISRDLTKRLPLGEVTTQGLEQLIGFREGITQALDADSPERRAMSEALRVGTPGCMEERYRLAYELHAKATASGHRQPSYWTWVQLGLRGVTDARGEAPTHQLVRTKWIPKGKALAAKDARSEQLTGNQKNNRKEQEA